MFQVTEVYSKESKGAVSAVASLQGYLLIASGPKITLNKWTGSELTAVAFYDAPLHVVSLNIVSIVNTSIHLYVVLKNPFILIVINNFPATKSNLLFLICFVRVHLDISKYGRLGSCHTGLPYP